MRRVVIFIMSFLLTVLVPHYAVQAAEQDEVILSTADGKAAIDVRLPDEAEGISTLRLTVRIEGDIDKLDSESPVEFEADGGIQYRLLEMRNHIQEGYVTIYISDTSKITERNEFRLGNLVPKTTEDTAVELTVSIPENGLEYVNGEGQLKNEISIASAAVSLKVNTADDAVPEDTPESMPEETPESTPEETPESAPEETPESTPEETPESTPGEAPDDPDETVSEESSESSADRQNPDKSQNHSQVQTGDNNGVLLYGVLTVLSAVCIGMVCIIQIQRRKKY